MASKAITTLIADHSDEIYNPDLPTVISVDHVVMDFNSASQQLNSLKEYFIAIMRRELMFKRFRALDGISLKVQKGDVFGILGTNGSGKSTLLKIVSGVLEPTEGSVSIEGNIAPLIEMGAGFDYELTARENIYLNGALLGYPKAFIDRHFDAIVDFAEIRDFLDMPLKNYSSGMVSRIAFAIATVIVPEILIVDEVLAVGDFMFRQKCERRIQSLINEHGTTVLIVSHSSEQIERLCNKAIWIEKGHVRMIGPASEVSQTYQAFGGHSGSQEAENAIFEYINSDIKPRTDIIESIAGKNRFSTNALVASKINAAYPARTVVLASGRDIGAFAAAVNLAGFLGGIALMTEPEEIPDDILTTLAAIAPEELIVLTHGAQANLVSTAKAAVGDCCEIKCLEYDTTDELTLLTNKMKEDRANPTASLTCSPSGTLSLPHTALVMGSNYGAAASTFAPLVASGIPLFSLTAQDSIIPIMRALQELEVERVFLVDAEENPAANEAESLMKQSGIDVTFVHEACSDSANSEALALLQEVTPSKTNGEILYITTQEGVVDALSIAPLVAIDQGTILTINHNDMDSMARATKLISEQREELKKLVIIGSNVCFTNIDRQVFAKAAALRNADTRS